MRWFAVYCKPQQECLADRLLTQKGYETFFPHEIRHIAKPMRAVKRPFMTRYIFVKFQPGHESFYEVGEQPGVKEVVCAGVNARGERVPFPIPDCVMHRLLGMTDATGLVNSRVRKNQLIINGRQAAVGDEVGFREESPFWGLVAIIEDILDGGEQIRLRLQQMFGAERSVMVNSRQVSGTVR
jgi:transcription antitermination factor NusG